MTGQSARRCVGVPAQAAALRAAAPIGISSSPSDEQRRNRDEQQQPDVGIRRRAEQVEQKQDDEQHRHRRRDGGARQRHRVAHGAGHCELGGHCCKFRSAFQRLQVRHQRVQIVFRQIRIGLHRRLARRFGLLRSSRARWRSTAGSRPRSTCCRHRPAALLITLARNRMADAALLGGIDLDAAIDSGFVLSRQRRTGTNQTRCRKQSKQTHSHPPQIRPQMKSMHLTATLADSAMRNNSPHRGGFSPHLAARGTFCIATLRFSYGSFAAQLLLSPQSRLSVLARTQRGVQQ